MVIVKIAIFVVFFLTERMYIGEAEKRKSKGKIRIKSVKLLGNQKYSDDGQLYNIISNACCMPTCTAKLNIVLKADIVNDNHKRF